MTKPHSKGLGALELMEEATFLLRRAPVEVLALYYLGTLPFMMGLLYFWADMSRNAHADSRLAGAALGLALLFIWMKQWQSRFCARLSRLVLGGSGTPPATGSTLAQVIFQPWSFVILPLALLITLPFGWCFAFFQNITVLGHGTDLRQVYRAARRQAALWPGQNHVLMFIFLLLGVVVFANLCLGAFFLPRMLKTLFGVDSLFARSNLFLLNSTFWAAMAVLSHICLDPLVKAAYLLRCHYGESLATGADLLAELKEARRAAGAALTVLLLSGALLFSTVNPPLAAASAPAAPAATARELDQTIQQVIAGPEFAWRLPRTAAEKEEVPGFIRSAVDFIKECAVSAGRWLKKVAEWVADILPKFKPAKEKASGRTGLSDYVFPLMYGLLAICLSVGGVLLWRQARAKGEVAPEAVQSQVVMAPDVSDENVTADELSEERWSALAHELFSKGELRLGLRALYLASLVCLAQERLIAIARFKSNRDYQRELGRFGHVLPEVVTSFSRNVAVFELAWYGSHRLDQGMVESFMANYERIVSGVRQG